VTSTKPYLLVAIHMWINDNGLTPHIRVDSSNNKTIPEKFSSMGITVFNIGSSAVSKLNIEDSKIEFYAMFSGINTHISIPVDTVLGIYAKENDVGMTFPISDNDDTPGKAIKPPEGKKQPPVLKLVE